MRKITPAREARRSVGLSRRRRQLADAVVETLEKRQLLTTYVVDKTVDLDDGNYAVGELTLREAINLSNANAGVDSITINVALANPQFLLFSGVLPITESVSIDGTNLHASGGQAIINGQNNATVFNVAVGTTVSLSDMTVRQGRSASGGGILNAGNLTLSNVVVTANSATVAGGGIYNTGTLTLNSGSIVSSNNASTSGGGIYNSAGTVIVGSSTLQGNSTGAAGIGGNIYADGGSISLTASTITTGSSGDGAGVYSTNSSSLTLTNSTISNNNSVKFGGGIYNTNSASISLTGSTISGNTSGLAGSGGGIYSLSGVITLNSSTVTNNRALGPNGGGIRNAGTLSITNSTISNNIANSSGGGIYNTSVGSNVTILGSTLSGNTSVTSDGGAIENTGGGTVKVINSTISGNTAANRGGGIHAFSGIVRVTNSTITNNRADSDNNATGIGGGLHMDVLAPNVTMNNTIVADNYVGAGVVEDDIQKINGSLTGNNNVIGSGGAGGLVDGVNGNQVGVDNPYLGPLANNGGTTLTHAILPLSPAINKGNTALAIHPDTLAALSTDQRGAARVNGAVVDVGAYEISLPLTLVVDKTVDLNDGNFGTGELTLREAVFLVNTFSGAYDTIHFNVGIANPQFLLFSGVLSILDSVTIDGTNLNAAGGQAIINGQNNATVFSIAGGETVGLADMTIRQGRSANGGGVFNAGSLTLSNVVVTANSATVAGGGIYNTGTLTLNSGTVVSSNNASTSGGGIFNIGGTVIANSSTLQGNSTGVAGIGGNIYADGGSISLTASTITTGSSGEGAGVYSTNSASLTLVSSTISNNNAVKFGGGIYNTNSASISLTGSTISGNTSGLAGSGGGIYSLSGGITLNGSTVTNNRALGPNGGGIRNAGTLNITNSTVSNNISNSSGGGIYSIGASSQVTLLSSTVSGNQSVTADGGGIVSTGNGNLRVLNSTISGNTAAHEGGGVMVFSGTATIVSSTITNNRADSDGNATGSAGGLYLSVLSPTVTMHNTIVADNYVGVGVVEDDIQKASGTLSGNNNLIGTGGSGGLVNGVGGNQVGVANPMLGALANNGGTTLTHLPLVGSPVIHAGDSNLAVDPDTLLPFASDQRGGPRYLGVAVDIGSVELVVPLTLIVDNTVDLNNGNFGVGNLTLREAIDLTNANPGLDTILFNVGLANPQFTLFSGTMAIVDSVNIDGTNLNGAGGKAIVHGNNNTQIFTVNASSVVTLADMTIRNGRAASGAAINNSGNVTLTGVTVTANSATVSGGGIFNSGTLTINGTSVISSNNASTTGGGVFNSGGTVVISASTLQSNTTNASGIGGGIYTAGGSVSLSGSTITSGSSGDGAGIYNTAGGSLSLTNSTISNNNALKFGGGIYSTGNSSISLTGSTISGNTSGIAGSGGGIFSDSGPVTINGSTITNNRAQGPSGGGIRNSGTLNITNSTVSNNISNSAGGGIYNTGASSQVTLLNSTVSGNQSVTSDGGGILNTGNGQIRILNSTLSGNSAARDGGGLMMFSGTATIINVTMTNNRADSDGNATGNGGALKLGVLNPIVTMHNTIAADNYVGVGVVEDDIQKASGTLSGNNNLIGTGGSGGLVNGVGGNQVGVANPMLGALANNGGTTLTHLPLVGSPVIHAGDSNQAVDPDTLLPFASDQRGGPRYLGVAVDIGSVELVLPLTLIVDNTVDLNNGNFGVGNLTLREAIDLANANPGLDTILFNVGLANPQFTLFSGSMVISDSVNIDGTNLNGAGGNANVHGNNNTQIFIVNSGAVVGFSDMTIRNGRATNGAALNNAGTVTMTGVTVTANTATLNGGGIYNTGTLTLNGGTTVSNGNASTTGAGIYNMGTLVMNTATIQGNAVSALGIGGGLYNNGGTANMTSATITTNTGSTGAGIYNTAAGSISLTNSTISNNSASGFGGGIFNTNSSTVTLTNTLVTGNSSGASGSGGGIYSFSGTITLTGSTVTNNRTLGPNGGAIRSGGTLNITNSTISNNISNASGGGIYSTSSNANLTIVNSTVSGNQSVTSTGGGIVSTGGAQLKVINSTISGNTAATNAGGIDAFSGTVTITNSTITKNRADSDNNGSGIAGGLYLNVLSPTVTMNNTIVADNYRGTGVVEDDIQKANGILTGASNLIGTGGSGGLVNAVDGNQVGVADPRLGALANNGGPTQTHQLLVGSTAIDAGDDLLAVDHTATPLATDQRGHARIGNGNVDIGAVEFTINLTAPAATNEGATYSLTIGPVVDNSANITDYRIDWGDGNVDTYTAAALAGLSNVVTHVYVDDDPTLTASDPYTITLGTRDAFTSPSFVNVAFKDITVNNVNPVAIMSAAPVNGVSGSPINVTGSFTDVGINDTINDWSWAVFKNGVSVASQTGLSTSFGYTPTSPGHYVFSLIATDDDTGMSAAALRTVHVKGAQIQTDPTDGTKTALFVYGTAGDDLIELNKLGVSLVRVKINGVIVGTFAPTGKVIVQGGTGNDTIVDSTVIQHTIMYGGEGNDTITANGASDILVGGEGDDVLVGANGDDMLIGGNGSDHLSGGNDEDVIIAGTTSYDAATQSNMASLDAILDAWTASGVAGASALLTGNVFNDAGIDTLLGGSQNDLFYGDTVLDNNDAAGGDTVIPL